MTGRAVPPHHLGNLPVVRPATSRARTQAPVLQSLKEQFDLAGYPAATSDVVALMVLEHQARMANLITWLGWEARTAPTLNSGSRSSPAPSADRVSHAASELVDYMLFVDETPLTRAVEGNSGFTEQFAGRGRKDRRGRSLRQLDLRTRLFRYPCSYMIQSEAFAALPSTAKQAVYQRLWAVLSGADSSARYKTLTPVDRQAVIEILQETQPDLPVVFGPITR